MELPTQIELKSALNKAYKEAGHNAYFGNGFKAGAEWMEQQLEPIITEYGINEIKLKERIAELEPKWIPTKFQDSIDNGDYIFKLKDGDIEDTTYARITNGYNPMYFSVGYFKIVLPK